MSDTWPEKDCLHMPSRMSHSLEVASQAPDTKVLKSGLRDKLITSPVWPAGRDGETDDDKSSLNSDTRELALACSPRTLASAKEVFDINEASGAASVAMLSAAFK
ncbi:hypothetical protein EYF80_020681 [Liparis tanakae]|uniref:Uncharacterized protein n=1 Tax=Liparis tanakae TaxID=230148 RepID=A0A4Z2HTL4_9TELE|nr:hypothetical protein EYF80_020681 [Liparis tanakae]